MIFLDMNLPKRLLETIIANISFDDEVYRAYGIEESRLEDFFDENLDTDWITNDDSWLLAGEVARLLNVPVPSLLYILEQVTVVTNADEIGVWSFGIRGAVPALYPLTESLFKESTVGKYCTVKFIPSQQSNPDPDKRRSSILIVEFNPDEKKDPDYAGICSLIHLLNEHHPYANEDHFEDEDPSPAPETNTLS